MNSLFFKHSLSDVQSESIGADTKIWQFVVILPQAKIGKECNICSHVFIENEVIIGDRVTIKNGVQIWDGVTIEDDVFIGPNVTFTNDSFPRSKKHPGSYEKTLIEQGASIGANVTILCGLTIGRGAMIGAGAVVVKDIPANSIVIGNPGRVIGFVTNKDDKTHSKFKEQQLKLGVIQNSLVGGVQLIRAPLIRDKRGILSFDEYGKHLPFIPKRYFVITDVPENEIRGEHAHRQLQQYLVCLRGSVKVLVDDGKNKEEFCLNSVDIGLYIPPKIWGVQFEYSNDALLLVLASDIYEESDYIRNYNEFLNSVSAN